MFPDTDQYPRESRLYIGFLTRLWYKVLSVLVGPEVIQINEYTHHCVSLTTETSNHRHYLHCILGWWGGGGGLYWCSCTNTMHIFGNCCQRVKHNNAINSEINISKLCFHTVNFNKKKLLKFLKLSAFQMLTCFEINAIM